MLDSSKTRWLYYWLPPFLWMAMIFYFSTDNFSGENTGSYVEMILKLFYPSAGRELIDWIHFLIRKGAHFTEYAILGTLYYRAFRGDSASRWDPGWAVYSLVAIAVYAVLDEFHQTFTSHRVGSIYDSMIDFSGALSAMIVIRALSYKNSRSD